MTKTAKKRAVKKVATVLKKKKKLPTAELVAREIAKREKIFKAANNAEKRVLIAKDVIAQIKAKKIKPFQGMFVRFREESCIGPRGCEPTVGSMQIAADADARELLLTNKISQCTCCALGSMFVSCTLYNNHTSAKDLQRCDWSIANWLDRSVQEEDDDTDGEPIRNGLNKFFSLTQLRLIEQTFEANEGYIRSNDEDETGRAYPKFKKEQYEFCQKYRRMDTRLVAIMRNIVRNKGTFKP